MLTLAVLLEEAADKGGLHRWSPWPPQQRSARQRRSARSLLHGNCLTQRGLSWQNRSLVGGEAGAGEGNEPSSSGSCKPCRDEQSPPSPAVPGLCTPGNGFSVRLVALEPRGPAKPPWSGEGPCSQLCIPAGFAHAPMGGSDAPAGRLFGPPRPHIHPSATSCVTDVLSRSRPCFCLCVQARPRLLSGLAGGKTDKKAGPSPAVPAQLHPSW